MRLFLISCLVMTCFAFSLHAAPYKVVQQKVEINEVLHIGKYETIIQVGHNPLDRFTLHRVVKLDRHHQPVKPHQLKGAFILLPGGGSNFDIYLIGPDGESLATFLALKGIDVYGYSPRTRGIAPDFCLENDCAAMQAWGISTYIEDIEYIRKHVSRLHHKRPVVGGLSLGAMLSIAAVDKKPNAYAGAILWEGTLYYDSPVKELFTDTCDYYRAQWQGGQYYDDQAYPFLKLLTQLYFYAPDDMSPIAPEMSNRDFFLYFITSPHNPPEGEAPNYTYAAGDMINGMTFVDEELLLQFVMQINNYEPIAIFRDYMCGLAGERTFTRRLRHFGQPILSIQAGLGFGAYAEDNLALFGSSDITRYIQPEYGHADIGTTINYVEVICLPIWNWLQEKILPQWRE